jgi:hypothetical protein
MMYIGHRLGNFKPFDAPSTPTFASHGDQYGAVIGPFKTRRAQKWAAQYGQGNPHFQTVDDAERLSKLPPAR